MCCGLRLHVIIISLFGIMFSGFLHFTWNFKPYESQLILKKDTDTTKHQENNVAILLRCLKFLEYINLFSNICSLIGAIRYKKYLLIPYMIINMIWILLVLACSLLLLILGLEFTGDGLIQSIEKEEDLTSYFTVLIPMATSFGIYLSFEGRWGKRSHISNHRWEGDNTIRICHCCPILQSHLLG